MAATESPARFPPPTADSERMVRENIGLLTKLARKYSLTCTIPYEDLVQAGSIGLIRACRSFDPRHGHTIATFCGRWITGAILHCIRDQAFLISFPSEFREKGPQVRRLAREGLSPPEIAQQAGISQAKVVELITAMSAAISLDHTLEVRMGREAEIQECHLGPALDVVERAAESLHPADTELLRYYFTSTTGARATFPTRSLQAFQRAARALLRGKRIPVASIEARIAWEAEAKRELTAARRRVDVRRQAAEQEAQEQAEAMQLALFAPMDPPLVAAPALPSEPIPAAPAAPGSTAATASASTSAAARGGARKPGLRPLRRPSARPPA